MTKTDYLQELVNKQAKLKQMIIEFQKPIYAHSLFDRKDVLMILKRFLVDEPDEDDTESMSAKARVVSCGDCAYSQLAQQLPLKELHSVHTEFPEKTIICEEEEDTDTTKPVFFC